MSEIQYQLLSLSKTKMRFVILKNLGFLIFTLCLGLAVIEIFFHIQDQNHLEILKMDEHYHNHGYVHNPQQFKIMKNKYPEMETSNTNWLLLRFGRLEIYIYRNEVYYDQRTRGPHSGDTVRILVVANENLKKYNFSCQYWESGGKVGNGHGFGPIRAEVPVKIQRNVDIAYGYPVNPFLISCPVPPRLIPDSFTLILGNSALLPVINSSVFSIPKVKIWNSFLTKEKPKNFAVCVKGLSFPNKDISLRLVEWLEMLKIMEANKVYIYIYNLMPDVEKVLKHYASQGFVERFPINLPGKLPNDPNKRQKFLRKYDNKYNANFEVIAWNDCFYRNLNNYKYFVPIDTDELIVPTNANLSSWTDIMQYIESVFPPGFGFEIATYNIFNEGYFLEGLPTDYIPGIPTYMHMLQHIYYTSNGKYSVEWSRKGIMDPKKALYLWNHWIWDCIDVASCGKLQVPLAVATRLHYTKWGRLERIAGEKIGDKCDRLNPSCLNYTEYHILHRWKDQLIKSVTSKAQIIGLPLKGADM